MERWQKIRKLGNLKFKFDSNLNLKYGSPDDWTKEKCTRGQQSIKNYCIEITERTEWARVILIQLTEKEFGQGAKQTWTFNRVKYRGKQRGETLSKFLPFWIWRILLSPKRRYTIFKSTTSLKNRKYGTPKPMKISRRRSSTFWLTWKP